MSDTKDLAPLGAGLPATPRASTQVAATREIAEVQGMVFMAKQFPRDEKTARERILAACRRPTLAEDAIYSYPRGGTTVTGPSIRLAEAIAQAWGNLLVGTKEVERTAGESTMEAYAWDLETNTRFSRSFQVPHVREKRGGNTNLEDPRDIYEATANQGSRRLRACILAAVPGDVVEEAMKEVEQTQRAKIGGDIKDATQKMLTAFESFKVTKKQIERKLQHNLETVSPAEILNLRRIFASIKDNFVAVDEVFPPEPEMNPDPIPQSAKDRVLARAQEIEAGSKSTPPSPQAEEKKPPKGKGPKVGSGPDDLPSEKGEQAEIF